MNKIALITGATSGIGKATAELFAKNNIAIIICGRRNAHLQTLYNSLKPIAKVYPLCFDIRDFEATKQSIESLPEAWKNISILINNAGGAHGLSTFNESDLEDMETMMDANVKGLLYISKLIIPNLIAKKHGHIVNVSSIAGKQAYANGLAYCASKAAVESISNAMRLELVPHGIKVTNIAPGAVQTEFSVVRFKGDITKANNVYKNFKPLDANDIADAIFYCVNAPNHVQIADMTIFAAAQSAATQIQKDL